MTARLSLKKKGSVKNADKLHSLYLKLLHWFYDKQDRRRASKYADQLDRCLRRTSERSIRVEECKSLIAEVRGKRASAIRHREKEIQLIRRLHQISLGKPGEEYVLRRYGYRDLSDRLDLLAILYHDAGNVRRAIEILEESRALCENQGVKFDSRDLLAEYRKEKSRAAVRQNGANRRKSAG